MNSSHKFFIQLAGAPGAGKSTLAKPLAKAIDAVIIDHDLLKSCFLEHGLEFEQSGKLAYSTQWALAEDLLEQERNIIMDSPCNYSMIVERGIALAQQYGHDYRHVECRVEDITLLDQRLRTRVPQRSQRTGVSIPPLGAGGHHHSKDYEALFRRWIYDRSCRPDNTRTIVVNSARSNPQDCVDAILKQLMQSDPQASEPLEELNTESSRPIPH